MIAESIVTNTIVDVLLFAMALALIITTLFIRPITSHRRFGTGAILSIAGLSLIAILSAAEIISMHVLPELLGASQAAQVRTYIDTRITWAVVALSAPLIAIGFFRVSIGRTRAMEQLRQSEARYRNIVHDQLDMIVRWKGDGTRIWVNDAYLHDHGLTREEAIGTSFFPQIVDVERLIEKRDALTPENPIYVKTHEFVRDDGETRIQEWRGRGIFDASGKLTEIQSIGRDITNRIRTARALQKSESRFRDFIENTPDLFWECDTQFRFTYCSGQSQQLLGYEPGHLMNHSVVEFVHPDDVDACETGRVALVREKRGWRNILVKFRHRNGSVRYVETSAEPTFDEEGNLIGHRGIDRDRTFQTLLLQLSQELVGSKSSEINVRIEKCLEQIGECYGLDRLSIWHIGGENLFRENAWVREASPANQLRIVSAPRMPEAYRTVLEQHDLYKVESVDDLAADSPERKFLDAQGVKSMLALPLQHEGAVVAIAACISTRSEKAWPEESATELRLLLEKISDARRQAETTLEILRRERDLSHTEELAEVGSFAFYPTEQSGDFPEAWAARFSAVQCELLEAKPSQASFELLFSRVHENDKTRIDAAFSAMTKSGKPFEQEFRFVNPSGQIVHVASRAELETNPGGPFNRIVGSCRNITDQINREEALVNALEENEALRERLQEENVLLREEIRTTTEFEQIIGESAPLRASLNLAARAAPTDVTILVLGETGTGKELVAKAIHQLSTRSENRLVSVNCTALPANLIESELFGHEKGAFTGATERRAGRFEIADGGTLFLDEIGDLPLDLQAKLLRVLEDGGFERIGGSKTLRPDVRLIAATNRDLEAAVRDGQFRADLYYRINTVPIELPPLRARREDIPMLAQHFVDKHSERLGKSVMAISSRMIEYLLNRDWPGNIRELENFIERSLISATGKVLSIGDQTPAAAQPVDNTSAKRLTELKSVEREHILHVLRDTGWVIDGTRGAAAVLGLAPSTLRSRMKRLGIVRDRI